jgi:hypothetical protein
MKLIHDCKSRRWVTKLNPPDCDIRVVTVRAQRYFVSAAVGGTGKMRGWHNRSAAENGIPDHS